MSLNKILVALGLDSLIGALISVVSALVIFLYYVSIAQSTTLEGIARVIDGDTLELNGAVIRLHGIDAPEADQTCGDRKGAPYRCGRVATQALIEWIGDQPIRCGTRNRDQYGRWIAVCTLADMDLNARLVRNGHALAYRRFSRDYVAAEDEAREQNQGMWAGTFTPPWDWRRGVR
ncbi:MAG: thermonuclease family protein [Aestuariivita sp.]|nr:thermonuclease family protein [Aestuariivita sp.]MCY4202714.1 thermonuclease family protein [Aestuariivita sp.]MCY4289359.1 thermonuclease family protein [Aestuariivita sp.]MCY4347758.1 thermonuclease family protein [Aestuariivita sp.]